MTKFGILARYLSIVMVILIANCVIQLDTQVSAAESETPVYFADQNLEAAVERTLGISDPTPTDMLSLVELWEYDEGINDLTGLEHAKNLSVLLLNKGNIVDVSILSQLTNLTELDLFLNQISDISPLRQLMNLQSLDLGLNNISDISALSQLGNLRMLDLSGNNIVDISGLARLTNLNILDVHWNQITDIYPLLELKNLEELYLYGNGVAELSPIRQLHNLRILWLNSCQVTDVSSLNGLKKLEELDLGNNPIQDISPLSGLPNLKELIILECGIEDISGIAGLTSLEYLHLRGNQIENIDAISELTNLTVLYLTSNQVSDISAVTGLINLEQLSLHNNRITDCSSLMGLTNLWWLDLARNQISDVNALGGLMKLTELNADYNRIADVTVLSKLKQLEELDLESNQITDISALSKLTNLMELRLEGNPLDCNAYCIDIPIIRENNPFVILSYDPMPTSCDCESIIHHTVYFVDANATGSNDGSSWHDAFNYLQDALTAAKYGDEIRVARGIYKPDQGVGVSSKDRDATFQLKNGITIKGSYAGLHAINANDLVVDPNERNVEEFETILSGDLADNDEGDWDDPSRDENSIHVVSGHNTDETAVLDGFTITAGNANGTWDSRRKVGGGLYFRMGCPIIVDCKFMGNSAVGHGGGAYCNPCIEYGKNAILVNCRFINNHAGRGGGIAAHGWSNVRILILNCVFVDNSAEEKGGAVVSNGYVLFKDCVIYGNSAPYAGGMYTYELGTTGEMPPHVYYKLIIQQNFALPGQSDAGVLKGIPICLQGDLNLEVGRLDVISVLFYGDGCINLGREALLKIVEWMGLHPTTIRTRVNGPGNIEIDAGQQLIIEGNSVVNLSASSDVLPDPVLDGRIIVNGSLVVQGNATLECTNVDVKLLDVNTPNDIHHNNITLQEASTGFGGEFFVSENANIRYNNIVSEGDRYLDLDPDPHANQRPTITHNSISVIIKEGRLSSQGTLLELRARNHHGVQESGAYHVSWEDSIFAEDQADNWVLEKLELKPGSKLNLTNRQGFEFQGPDEPYPETVYVKELVLGPNSVLNTALQTLYYKRLVDPNGVELVRDPNDPEATLTNGARFMDIPLLGFSLGIIAMNDQTEFDVRVRKDPINTNSANPNDQYIRRLEDYPDIPVGSGGIMEMRTWVPGEEQAEVVTAKGAFARAGDEDITIKFEYMFPNEDPGDACIVVYLSDQPEVNHESRTPIALIYPPDSSRPGSWDSHRFAVFSITIPHGNLNFTRGTYVELELHGHNVRCWIDNWDPIVSCTTKCGDFDKSYGVKINDYLILLAEYGVSEIGPDNYCLDIFPDGCVTVDDLMLWGSIVELCPPEELVLAMVSSHFSERALFGNSSEDSIQATGLVLYGKTGTEEDWRYDANLCDLDLSGICLSRQKTDGRGRLITNKKKNGSLYQIQNNIGLVCLIGLGQDIVQRTNLSCPDSTKTLSVGFNGGYENGVPLMDAVFHPLDSNAVYVVPVLVKDSNNAYPAAAKLRLSQAAGNPYTVEAVYGLDPAKTPNQGIEILAPDAANKVLEPDYLHVKEIEIDRSGSYVYVLSSHEQNKNGWLLIYQEKTGDLIKAFNLSDPCDFLPDVNAPSALVVSNQEIVSMPSDVSNQYDKLYVTSSEKSANEDEDLSVKIYSFLLNLDTLATDPNTTLLEFDRVIEINCHGLEPDPNILGEYDDLYDPNHYVSVITSTTEDPNGTLYVVGFTTPRFYDDKETKEQYWKRKTTFFTSPFLAVVEPNSVTSSVKPIVGVALPLSVSWCGFTYEDNVDAMHCTDTNPITLTQFSCLADHWLKSIRGTGIAGYGH